jgi:hypothetical protein
MDSSLPLLLLLDDSVRCFAVAAVVADPAVDVPAASLRGDLLKFFCWARRGFEVLAAVARSSPA